MEGGDKKSKKMNGVQRLAYDEDFNKVFNFSEQLSIPEPTKQQVLVQVHATSIGAGEVKMAKGWLPKMLLGEALPVCPGLDIAGVVVAVGKEVFRFKKGDKVFGSLPVARQGGMQEYTVVEESSLCLKPDTLSFAEAASLPVSGATALLACKSTGLFSSLAPPAPEHKNKGEVNEKTKREKQDEKEEVDDDDDVLRMQKKNKKNKRVMIEGEMSTSSSPGKDGEGKGSGDKEKEGGTKDKGQDTSLAVLVRGASGGVGSLLLQIVRAQGATYVVGVSSKSELVKGLGADECINYKELEPEHKGDWVAAVEGLGCKFDVIFDCVGGSFHQCAGRLLKPGTGVFVAVASEDVQGKIGVGFMLGMMSTTISRKFWSSFGYPKYRLPISDSVGQEDLQMLAHYTQSGQVRAVLDSQHAFSREGAIAMYEKSNSGRTKGKLVMSIIDGRQT